MSRGFVREGDQEEEPIIAPRAPLPEGIINHVTAHGLELLLKEQESLEADKRRLQTDKSSEHRLEIRVIDIKLTLLAERFKSAQVVEPSSETQDEVRFGAVVEYRMGMDGPSVKFQIVGVDEADVKQKKIAFTSPIARALIGIKVGEEREFALGDELRKVSVLKIEYPY